MRRMWTKLKIDTPAFDITDNLRGHGRGVAVVGEGRQRLGTANRLPRPTRPCRTTARPRTDRYRPPQAPRRTESAGVPSPHLTTRETEASPACRLRRRLTTARRAERWRNGQCQRRLVEDRISAESGRRLCAPPRTALSALSHTQKTTDSTLRDSRSAQSNETELKQFISFSLYTPCKILASLSPVHGGYSVTVMSFT